MISHTGPFLHRPTAACLYDIPYRTVFAVTVRPVEGQVATHHRTFVYLKIWVAEIKLERSALPFSSADLFKIQKFKFVLLGTAEFTFQPKIVFQHQQGRFVCMADREGEVEWREGFGTSE